MDAATDNALDTKHVLLAHEIAMGIREVREILKDLGVSDSEWRLIQREPRFQALLSSKITEWNGAINTPARTKIKAAAIVEMNLDIYQLALADESVPLPQKLAITQFMAKLGGMTEDRRNDGVPGTGNTSGFQVRIFLGGAGSNPVVIDGQSEPETPKVLTVD